MQTQQTECHRNSLPMSAQNKLDDADYALCAVRGLSDLLCELPDMQVVNPGNLNALLNILADRLEIALNI